MSGAYGGATYGGAAYLPVVGQSTFSGTFPYQVITEIAFASNPLDNPAVWTDVSIYVVSIDVHRGRQHELNRFEAGTATVVLDNKDGRFSPFNTSSAYNPNVVPYKQLRVRALYNGVYYPIYRGHINSWPVKWPGPADSNVAVQATDATKILNLKRAASLSNYSTTVLADSPTAYYRLGDAPQTGGADSFPVADSSGNGNTGTVSGLTASGTTNPVAFLGAAPLIVASTDAAFDCGTRPNPFSSPYGAVAGPAGITLGTASNWTMLAWVTCRDFHAGDQIFFCSNGSSYAKVTAKDSTGTLTAASSDGTHTISFDSFQQLKSGTTALVALTWTAATTTLNLWINTLNDNSGSNASLSYSGLTTQWGQINGLFDECAVWTTKDLIGLSKLAGYYTAGTTPRVGELSGARISAFLSAIGWPSSLTKVDAGLLTVQGAVSSDVTNAVLAGMQTVTDTEQGDLFVGADGSVVFYDHLHKYKTPNGIAGLTLGDSGTTGPGGESPYLLDSVDIEFDDLDLYNQVTITPSGLGSQTASDSTSQTSYGPRTLSNAGIHNKATDANNQASWLIGKYKSPLQRIRSVTFQPLSDPTVLLPAALGFELLTRVTVKRRPKDGQASTFSQDSLIEGISLKITLGYMECTWALSPTDAAPVMWIIDDPVAGKIVDGSTQSPPVAIGF